MKTILQTEFIWFSLIFLGACDGQADTSSPLTTPSTPEPIMVELDHPFTLHVGQEATADQMRLIVTDLTDIRCPSAVECAEKGYTQISVNIVEGDRPPQTYLMNSDPFYQPEMGVGTSIFTYNKYSIELTDVTPYPELPEEKIHLEEYLVTFVISKNE